LHGSAYAQTKRMHVFVNWLNPQINRGELWHIWSDDNGQTFSGWYWAHGNPGRPWAATSRAAFLFASMGRGCAEVEVDLESTTVPPRVICQVSR
jgi:hypothetical protein